MRGAGFAVITAAEGQRRQAILANCLTIRGWPGFIAALMASQIRFLISSTGPIPMAFLSVVN
jgi:hypothetical protein